MFQIDKVVPVVQLGVLYREQYHPITLNNKLHHRCLYFGSAYASQGSNCLQKLFQSKVTHSHTDAIL